MSDALRIAWFSAFSHPSVEDRIASVYADRLLIPRLIKNRFEIELFSSAEGEFEGLSIAHYLNAWKRHQESPFDIFFYQFEDGREFDFIRIMLGLIPGVVWAHESFTLRPGPAALDKSIWQEKLRACNQQRDCPPAPKPPRRLREPALAVLALFSDPSQHLRFRKEAGIRLETQTQGQRSANLFWPVDPASVGLYQPEFSGTFACYGSLGVEHRAHKILEALSGLSQKCRVLWLIDDFEWSHARALLSEYSVSQVELVRGRTIENWRKILERSDAVLAPYFSDFGQPGPYLNLALMSGRPCLVSDNQSFDHLGDDLVMKVRAGRQEATAFRAAMAALLDSRGFSGREAQRQFALEYFSADVVATELAMLLRRAAPLCREAMARAETLRAEALQGIMSEMEERACELSLSAALPGESIWQSVYAGTFKEFGWTR